MWKISSLLLAVHICGAVAGNIHRNEWNHQQQPVHQPSYYSQYGSVIHDLNSYQNKLHQQGLAPSHQTPDFPPFILTNNASPDVYNVNYQPNQPESVQWNQHSIPQNYQHKAKAPGAPLPEQKGKPKCNHSVVKTDKGNESEKAKKPILAVDFKWPVIKHVKIVDKIHATENALIKSLSEALKKISEDVETKVTTIKLFLDKSVDNINSAKGAAYQQFAIESSKLVDTIHKKLKTIEGQLEKLKLGASGKIADSDFEDESPTNIDDIAPKTNVDHSEIEKELRSIDLDAELRGDLKSSISDAVKNAHERFNKLIDENISKINNRIADITFKFEDAFSKFQETLGRLPTPPKVYTPPTYKLTTPKPIPTKFYGKSTTPEFFKYTVSPYLYKEHFLDVHGKAISELNRKDEDVGALEIVDNAKDDLAKSVNETTKLKPSVAAADQTDDKEPSSKEDVKPTDELKSNVDTAKSLDDLQSQVLKNVKDTLKSDVEALEAIEKNQSEVLANPEDKLKSDKVEGDIEAALVMGLINKKEKNSNGGSSDDLTKKLGLIEDADAFDDSKIIFDNNDDEEEIDDDEDILSADELRALDEVEYSTNIPKLDKEDSQLAQPNQAGSLRFDELEVIQLIPVIIAQLRKGHVLESEQKTLQLVLGDLWPLILDEAKRAEGENMNPLLKTIIDSEEVRLAKRDITKQIGNDIYKNSVRRVYRGGDETAQKPYLSLDDDRKLLAPSERLLKMVAAIVHKANVMEKSRAKLKQKQKRRNMRKKSQKNPLGIVTVEKPRQRFMDRILGINRIKRSIIKYTSDLDDMKALLEQVNEANNSEEDQEKDEDASDSKWDEYVDDNYYDDEDLESEEDQNVYPVNTLSWNQRNYYEDGSVNEFIQLAKQRDRREQSGAAYEKEDGSGEDNDDY